jgi:hypothetical protein
MSRFTDFFWPTLDKPTPAEIEEDDTSEAADIAAAGMEGWAQSPELALEEARRLADSEEDRRRTTEGKASTYLLFASAFAAALIPFLPGILEGKTGSAPRWLIAIILIVATLYLMAAGVWAFRALRVGTYHRLGVAELVQVWRHKNPKRELIRKTFALARMNYRVINEKVSCIKLVHEFMARSCVAFGVLVVVESGWEAVHSLTATHEHQAVIDTKGQPRPEVSGAPSPTPRAFDSPSTSPPSIRTKPSAAGTVSGTVKPSADSSSEPTKSVGATGSGVNAPIVPSVKGPADPTGGVPGKQ